MEQIALIDVLSEDDLLIFTASQDLSEETHVHNSYNAETKSDQESESLLSETRQVDQAPQWTESPERTVYSRKINLRKSLAWDNAFFTSEGVLNNEELAIVNSTFQKNELSMLPQIREDLRRSADSSSTLESDSWALENLETDLFENLRASIQNSYGNADKASGEIHSSRRQQEQTNTNWHRSTVGTSVSKINHLNVLEKSGSIQTMIEYAAEECTAGKKPTAKAGELKSLVKPPRNVPRVPTLPTVSGRNASDLRSVNSRSNSTKASGLVSNRQFLGSSKKFQPDSSSANSSSTLLSSFDPSQRNVIFPAVSFASKCNPSAPKGQRPQEATRRRVNPWNSNNSIRSTSKAPLRVSKSKIVQRNLSCSPVSQKYAIESSSVSPASSLDSLASESSSIFCPSKAGDCTDVSEFGVASSTSSLNIQYDGPPYLELQKPNIISPNHTRLKPTLSASVQPLNDLGRSSIDGKRNLRSFKPSGLRMPSPKIGYFDAKQNKLSSHAVGTEVAFQKISGSSTTCGPNILRSSRTPNLKAAGRSSSVSCESRQPPKRPSCGETAASAKDSPKASQLQITPRTVGKNHKPNTEVRKDVYAGTREVNCSNSLKVEDDGAQDGGSSFRCALEDVGHTSLKSITSDSAKTEESLVYANSAVSGEKCKSLHLPDQAGEAGKKGLLTLLSAEKCGSLENENFIPGDQMVTSSKFCNSENLDQAMVELEKYATLLCLSDKNSCASEI